MNYIDRNLVHQFFSLLNEHNICYLLIKNIDHELPDHLADGKDIDILVKEENKSALEACYWA